MRTSETGRTLNPHVPLSSKASSIDDAAGGDAVHQVK